MAITISYASTQSGDTPRYSKAIQKTLRHLELREKLLRQVAVHRRIREEHRRFQQLTIPYQALQAQTLQAQALEAQMLQTRVLEMPPLQTLEVLSRENTRLLSPVALHRVLAPADPAWKYKAITDLLLRELQDNPMQNLIRDISYWEAIQRQLVGPWPLVGPWRDAETLRWLLWALQEGDSGDREAALAELATMIRRPRLGSEASLELRQRSWLMGMSPDDYWRKVVLPQALLLVWGASKVPRRIQLAGKGQGRVLDEHGKWTPQAPVDRLDEELLGSYLFAEIPKAAVCILTDHDYPKPASELWHAPPIHKKDGQGTIDRIPRVVRLQPRELDLTRRPGHSCGPSPEVMAILKLDLQKFATNASPRQRQILELLLKGQSLPEIASELRITSQAVHGQLNRLRQKHQAG